MRILTASVGDHEVVLVDFAVCFPNDFVVVVVDANLAVVDVVGPFHPFNVVEVAKFDDLDGAQVSVVDLFVVP